MRKQNSGQRIAVATLSLLASSAIGAYLAFTGLNGHPDEVAAENAGTEALRVAGVAEQIPRDAPTASVEVGQTGHGNVFTPTSNAAQVAQSEGQQQDSSGKQFNDWTIRCQKNEAGAVLGCEAFQRLSVRDTGQRFLELAVGYPEGGETPLAIFVLPLGLWLPPGMDFQIDDGDPLRTPIQRCIQGGCLVQLPLTPELLAEMKQGQQLAIQVYRQKDDPIAVPISLIGFTAALEEIKP